jgi:hypothetical protein
MSVIDYDGACAAIIEAIKKQALGASPTALLKLAEAYAWATYPNQSHGGGTVIDKD